MSISKIFDLGAYVAPLFRRPPVVQMAALCTRKHNGETQVLFVQSSSGRWILPKGWPVDGKDGAETALLEAWEEAGVREGKPSGNAIGHFATVKQIDNEIEVPCKTYVYPIQVHEMSKDYPEAGQRDRKWVALGEASQLADDPGLQDLLHDFATSRAA